MATQIERLQQYDEVSTETRELFNKKNTDYGDAFADYGVVGVLVRMGDKLRRYISVTNKGVSLVNDEALRDTLMDLRNYATMAIMLMDEREIIQNMTPLKSEYPLTYSESYEGKYTERPVIKDETLNSPYTFPIPKGYVTCNPTMTALSYGSYKPSWFNKHIQKFLDKWKM